MEKLSDFKKSFEESKQRRRILEAILVKSTNEDSYRLPTIKEFILSEVVNGTIYHTGGKAGKLNYQKFNYPLDERYENRLTEYFNDQMSSAKKPLNPKIDDALKKMTQCHWVYVPEPSDNYPTCELYDHFHGFAGGGICPVVMESTFSLPQETVRDVQKNIIPSMSKAEKSDVRGIGKAMRRFVDEDLDYIRKHYYW
jgi:hypothetical protein